MKDEKRINEDFSKLISDANQDHGKVGIPLKRHDSAYIMLTSKAEDYLRQATAVDHNLLKWHLHVCQCVLGNVVIEQSSLKTFLSGLTADIVRAKALTNPAYNKYIDIVTPYIQIVMQETMASANKIDEKYFKEYQLVDLFQLLAKYKKIKFYTDSDGKRYALVSSFPTDVKNQNLFYFFGKSRMKWLKRWGFQLMIGEDFNWYLSSEVTLVEGFDQLFKDVVKDDLGYDFGDNIKLRFLKNN